MRVYNTSPEVSRRTVHSVHSCVHGAAIEKSHDGNYVPGILYQADVCAAGIQVRLLFRPQARQHDGGATAQPHGGGAVS